MVLTIGSLSLLSKGEQHGAGLLLVCVSVMPCGALAARLPAAPHVDATPPVVTAGAPGYSADLGVKNGRIRGRGRSANIANRFLGLVVPRLYVQLCPSTHTENCTGPLSACPVCRSRIVMDVDTGTDDALAILHNNLTLEVLGTSCVAGNVTADQVVINTRKVLDLRRMRATSRSRPAPYSRSSSEPAERPISRPRRARRH